MCRSFSKNVRNIWQRVCSQEAGEGGAFERGGVAYGIFDFRLRKKVTAF